MKRIFGKATMVLAILASMAMVGQNSAYGAASGVVTGHGAISPGLTTTPTDQTFNFTTDITVGVTTKPGPAAGSFSCTFTGSGAQETVVTGGGTGTGSCSGTISVSCTISYTRAGPVVTVTGSCTIGGTTQTLIGVFVFVAGSAPPVTSYTLAGSATLV
jgi:hypothetical protein